VAQKAGLKLVAAHTSTASEWQYYQWRHALLFPAQGKPSAFWSPGQAAQQEPRSMQILMHWARRLYLQRWISRVLDATGLGDNFVFVLQKS